MMQSDYGRNCQVLLHNVKLSIKLKCMQKSMQKPYLFNMHSFTFTFLIFDAKLRGT